MMNLCIFACKNPRIILRCASDTIFQYSPTESMKLRIINGIKVNPVRFKSKMPPPPGVMPFDPQRIPYVRPDFHRKDRNYVLLLIPLVTFGLGTWQVKRLKWKTNLINTIKERTSVEPVPLPNDPKELADMEYTRVTVTGTFDHDYEILYGPRQCIIDGEPNSQVLSNTGQGSFGYNLVTPLVRSDTGDRILVNRGWIRTNTTKKEKRPWSVTEGEQTVTGLVRLHEEPGMIGPQTTTKWKVWHYRDIDSMAKATGCLPIYIDATEDHSIPNNLWGGQTLMTFRNEHMSYIVTWYSLTVATSYMWWARYMKK